MIAHRLCAVALALTMLSWVGPLAADGCFVTEIEVKAVPGSPVAVSSPKQEAILATDGRRVQVVLRTHFDQGPKELAWVVPVPAQPTNIRTCDGSVFAGLDQLTAPRFFTIQPSHPDSGLHLGCASAGLLNKEGEASSPLSVRVESQGRAGIYNYVVLSSQNPNDLEKWLTEHKYAVPKDAAKVFKKYTDKGWHWLAMRVRAEAAKEQTLAPQPITYTYEGELTFPLVISTISAAARSEIVLYLVGKTNFDTVNWNSVDLGDYTGRAGNHQIGMLHVQLDPRSPSGTTYENGVKKLTQIHGGHLFMRELCEQWQLFGHAEMGRRFDDILDADLIDSIGPAQTITRLRAFVKRADMDLDVRLEAKKAERQIQNRIYVNANQVAARSGTANNALFLCSLPVVGAGLARSGRRKTGRGRANVLVVLVCLMLVMM